MNTSKKLSFVIFLTFLITKLNAQDYTNLSVACLMKGENELANQYAKRAWSIRASTHVSYILAHSNYILNNNDTAAFYAGIALYDSNIYQDISLNSNQKKQLGVILQYYKALNHQRSRNLVTTLYQAYPRYKVIRARLTLNNESTITSKNLLKIQALKEQENRLPTWDQYIDSLKNANLPDSIISQLQTEKLIDETSINSINTPESLSHALDQFYGSSRISEELIEVGWIDSTFKKNRSPNPWDLEYLDPESNPYKHTQVFDHYYYPELYEKKDFLMYPMISIYVNYLGGKIDSTNYYVKRFKLNKKNLLPFYKKVFPLIVENKVRLSIFLKTYEL